MPIKICLPKYAVKSAEGTAIINKMFVESQEKIITYRYVDKIGNINLAKSKAYAMILLEFTNF